jgi:pyridoxine 5-phosphate synthase
MTTTMRLYINVDHVATVRQARRADEPDPVEAAILCQAAGADGITAHLREDRRHIQDHDLERMRPAVKVLNVELATSSEIVALTCRLRPYQATLVPEKREEITTEGGLDLLRSGSRLRETIRRLDEAGIRISLFVDPDLATLDVAKDLGVPAVELHTGRYANTWRRSDEAIDAGHGLTYLNVQPVAAIPEIEELNIGHSVIGRALMTGMSSAVQEMARLVKGARV